MFDGFNALERLGSLSLFNCYQSHPTWNAFHDWVGVFEMMMMMMVVVVVVVVVVVIIFKNLLAYRAWRAWIFTSFSCLFFSPRISSFRNTRPLYKPRWTLDVLSLQFVFELPLFSWGPLRWLELNQLEVVGFPPWILRLTRGTLDSERLLAGSWAADRKSLVEHWKFMIWSFLPKSFQDLQRWDLFRGLFLLSKYRMDSTGHERLCGNDQNPRPAGFHIPKLLKNIFFILMWKPSQICIDSVLTHPFFCMFFFVIFAISGWPICMQLVICMVILGNSGLKYHRFKTWFYIHPNKL